MELAMQLKKINLELNLGWVPRNQNIEADALTNSEFAGFCPSKRIEKDFEDMQFIILNELMNKAGEMDKDIKMAKSSKELKGDRPEETKFKKKRGQTRFGMRPPEKRIPKMHGSVLKMPGKSPFSNGTNGNGKLNGMNGQKRDKLDMSLDDLIRSDQVIDLEADDDVGASHHPRREQVLRSFRQMGLHPDTAHLRRAPVDKDGFHGGRRRDDGRGQRRRWSPAEKVQRWVAWVIQAGYKELGIMLAEGGWVDLAALAAAIPRSRPDFGDFDAEKLKVFIQDSDVDGRFEFNPANQLRKVPKDMRKAKSQRSPFERKAAGNAVPRDPMDTIEVASSASSGRGRRHARSPSLSSDSDGIGPNDDLEDAALAAECENLRVSGDVEEAKPVKAETMRWPTQVTVPKPDPPPGDYWTRYQDEGGGEYWYFYDGPLGQWWAGADATTIMAYVADS
eukprot:s861_g36.t1